MTFFKELFAAPVFDDEFKTQQAYLLNIILWTLICVPIPFVIYTLVLTPGNSSRTFIQAIFGETVNVILLLMLRHGRVRAASIIQVSAFWFFFTVTAFTGNGVQSEAYLLGYGLVIAIAGILLGGTGALVFTFLSLAAGGWMVYRQTQGVIISEFDNSPLTTWVVSFVLFPVGVVLQRLASRTLRMTLGRARASEEKYRLISQVSSDYTFASEVDIRGAIKLSWVAGAFEKMTGYTFEEYVASGGWLAHVHPDDLEKDSEDMNILLKNQNVINSDIRTYAKNREIRWERIFAHPVWDEKENRLIGIVGAVQDVTQEKQAEEKIIETLLQQSAILNGIPDMAWLKDINSRYIAVNEQFVKTAGMKMEEIAGKTDFDIWQGSFAEKYRNDDLEVIRTRRQRKNAEEFQIDSAGREFWVETTKTPILNAEGDVIGTTGIAHEITERKKAEEFEQRRRIMLEKVVLLGKRVTESDNLPSTIKKIWHGVHDDLGFDRLAIFLFNPKHNSMDDTVGTNNAGEMVDHWNISFPIGSTFAALLQNPDGIYFTHNYDEENNIPEGHEMYGIKDYVAVAAWAGDKPVAVICADHGITRHPITPEQLEGLRLFAGYAGLAIENARLNSALENELGERKNLIVELEAKNAELERFTYTVSHDLKSPLVTIRGFLGYLERDAQEGNYEKLRHDKQRIEAAVEKMQNLLKDLLELSRIGRLMNTPVEIPFNDIVKDTLEIMDGQIKEKNVLIVYQNNNIIINCDRVRMLEVLQNLLDNAIKFMGDQPDPYIEIGTSINDRNETIFYIKDNGIGIAPEFQEKIFGLFNKLTSDSEGTGIGLSLVKRIIEVHGGRIWVKSQVGMGTTFYFTIPASNA